MDVSIEKVINQTPNFMNYKLQTLAGENLFIGIDSHLKSWKISIYSDMLELKTFTQPAVSSKLMDYLHKHYPGANYHCVYEAGFSGFSVHRELTQMGANCIVTHPADVPTSDKERKSKSDKVDSRKLARGLKNGELKAIFIPDKLQEQDRALLRTRDRVIRNRTRVKNRIKSFLMYWGITLPEGFQGKTWSKDFLLWLKKVPLSSSCRSALNTYLAEVNHLSQSLGLLDQDIKQLSNSSRYASKVKLLMGIPSIGLTSAMILLTEIGDINRFKTFKALCCYFGLIPNTKSSGETERTGRMTKRGNRHLKYILIECDWTAMRKDPALLMSFKAAAVKTTPNKAIIKVARKLLNRIRFVLKSEEQYVIGVVQ